MTGTSSSGTISREGRPGLKAFLDIGQDECPPELYSRISSRLYRWQPLIVGEYDGTLCLKWGLKPKQCGTADNPPSLCRLEDFFNILQQEVWHVRTS